MNILLIGDTATQQAFLTGINDRFSIINDPVSDTESRLGVTQKRVLMSGDVVFVVDINTTIHDNIGNLATLFDASEAKAVIYAFTEEAEATSELLLPNTHQHVATGIFQSVDRSAEAVTLEACAIFDSTLSSVPAEKNNEADNKEASENTPTATSSKPNVVRRFFGSPQSDGANANDPDNIPLRAMRPT